MLELPTSEATLDALPSTLLGLLPPLLPLDNTPSKFRIDPTSGNKSALPETLTLALFSLLNLLELMLKPTESYGSSSGAGSLLQSGLLATLCMPVLACVVMAEALELPMVALPGKRRNKQRMQLPGVVAALLLGGDRRGSLLLEEEVVLLKAKLGLVVAAVAECFSAINMNVKLMSRTPVFSQSEAAR